MAQDKATMSDDGRTQRSPKATVDAAVRTLRTIELLVDRPDGVGVSELAAAEGVNKALIHRVLASLVAAGWATRDPTTGRYHLSTRLLRMAAHWYKGLGIAQLASPVLQPVAERTSCHVEISRFFEGMPRILFVAEPRRTPTGLRVASHVGEPQTPHAAAAGKVWLASLGSREFDAYLRDYKIRAITPNTITNEDDLRAEIETVRRDGVAFSRYEDRDGVFAVAVPIRRSTMIEETVGALALGRPFANVKMTDELVIVDEARSAAAELGAVFPIWGPLPR